LKVFNWNGTKISLLECDVLIDCCFTSKNFRSLALGFYLDTSNIGISKLSISPCTIREMDFNWKQPLDDKSMLYFMRKFPQLETLALKATMERRETVDNLFDQVLCIFLRYLSRIPNLDFEIDLAPIYISKYLVSLLKEENIEV
jgi:hypothetical protein